MGKQLFEKKYSRGQGKKDDKDQVLEVLGCPDLNGSCYKENPSTYGINGTEFSQVLAQISNFFEKLEIFSRFNPRSLIGDRWWVVNSTIASPLA
ncbi:hypothetical protein J5X98_08975 [Leptothermofonsia sichuanensis E412]|uniref:hypothetical protein n=1 Tax=Leptothermofonsia sichuanensis TaxID=2917832 RepID=UPI001CA6B233|nr:hypothetical protein [Leptothermofonsia sichuanensis]QZZ22481.1 hypothetical protein J5X98_08975 [Leptothermofonsia sichuanensis E412]